MGVKRSAFDDVSNIRISDQREHAGVKNSKGVVQELKPKASTLEKPSGLLRPAQRPLNPVGPRAIANADNIIQTSAPASVQQQNNAPNTEQSSLVTFAKRSNTIFKDSEGQSNLQSQAIGRPVHQSLGPRHHKSQPQLKQEQPVLRRTHSKAFMTSTDVNHEQELQAVSLVDSTSDLEEKHAVADYDNDIKDYSAGAADLETSGKQDRQLPALPLLSEPEEYWEEEDEEETYDEQGYTTAHSTRSRGDNTTGGATTILLPRFTNTIKQELELAREIVENSRTAEEIEDEAWDTSMVAEYGDEIFGYMRELEVSAVILAVLNMALLTIHR